MNQVRIVVDNLLALWIVLGRRRAPWRLAAVVTLSVLVVWVMRWITPDPYLLPLVNAVDVFVTYLLLQTTMTCPMLAVLGMLGLTVAEGRGLCPVPPADKARLSMRSVLAWIAERDTWVEERGERVAAASVAVWPGPIPGGNASDRIPPGGTFVTGKRTPDA